MTLAAAVLLLAGCKEEERCPVTADTGQPFTLNEKECALVDRNMVVTFESVVEDSRCPPDVACVWEGNARVALTWSIAESTPERFELNTHDMFTRDTVIRGYTIRLTGLDPLRTSDRPMESTDYRAHLLVTR